jgi:hypothetical protein
MRAVCAIASGYRAAAMPRTPEALADMLAAIDAQGWEVRQ